MPGPDESKATQKPAVAPEVDASAIDPEATSEDAASTAAEAPDVEDLVEVVGDTATADPSDAGAPEGDLEGEVIEPEIIELPSPLELALAANEKLQGDYDQLQARLRTVSKAYRDLQDDMARFRKRVEEQGKAKEERQRFEVVQAIFDPVQNLKRSLSSPGEDVNALVDGLKIVMHQFSDSLVKLGLAEVPGEGALFDPRVHEALAITPVLEPEQDGKVIMVHRTGYEVNGKVVQAAQVVVGKHEEEPAEA